MNFLATIRSKAKRVYETVRSSTDKLKDVIPVLSLPLSINDDGTSGLEIFSSIGDDVAEVNSVLQSFKDALMATAEDGNTPVITTGGGVYGISLDLGELEEGVIRDVDLTLQEITETQGNKEYTIFHFSDNQGQPEVTVNTDNPMFGGQNFIELLTAAVHGQTINEAVGMALNKAIEVYSSSHRQESTLLEAADSFYSEQAGLFTNRFESLNDITDVLKTGLQNGLEGVLQSIKQLYTALNGLSSNETGYKFVDNTQYAIQDFSTGVVDCLSTVLETVSSILMLVGGAVLKVVGVITAVFNKIYQKIRSFLDSNYVTQAYARLNTLDCGYYDLPYGVAQGTIPSEVLEVLISDDSKFIGYSRLIETGSVSIQLPGGHFILTYDTPGVEITAASKVHYCFRVNMYCSKSPFECNSDLLYSDLTYVPGTSPNSDVDGGTLTISMNQNADPGLVFEEFLTVYGDQLSNPGNIQGSGLPETDAIYRRRAMNGLAWFMFYCALVKILKVESLTYNWNLVYNTNITDPTQLHENDLFWLPIIRTKTNYWNNAEQVAVNVLNTKTWGAWYQTGAKNYEANSLNCISLVPWFQDIADKADEHSMTDTTSQSGSIFHGLWLPDGTMDDLLYGPTTGMDDSDKLPAFDDFDGFGDEFLIMPLYEAENVVATTWKIIAVAAISAAVVIAATVLVSKTIRKCRAKRAAAAETAWENYKQSPTDTNFNGYLKAVKKNNRFVKIFGGTSYSKDGFWGTASTDSEVTSSLGIGTIYQLIKGSLT